MTAIGHTRSHTLSDVAADISLNAPVEVGAYLINQYNDLRYREQNMHQEKSRNVQTYNNRNNKHKYWFIIYVVILMLICFFIKKLPIFNKIIENIIP